MTRRLLRKGENLGGQTDVNLGSAGFGRKNYDACMIRYGYLIYFYTHQQALFSYGHMPISTKKGNRCFDASPLNINPPCTRSPASEPICPSDSRQYRNHQF